MVFHVNATNTLQDDIVMGTLSVRENLSFSAALRLNMSSKERRARVDKVIRELGLESCADTKVAMVCTYAHERICMYVECKPWYKPQYANLFLEEKNYYFLKEFSNFK